MKKFPHYFQYDAMDCGPTALKIIAEYYGKKYALQTLREKCFVTREGASLLGISDAAESIGFRTSGVCLTFEQLCQNMPLPCILHWNQSHFVVCYRILNHGSERKEIFISDPAGGLICYTETEFKKCWISHERQGQYCGYALLLEPTPLFFKKEDDSCKQQKNISHFFRYFLPYTSHIAQLIFGIFLGCILQLIFPFLTQALVDVGIKEGDLNFILLILFAQLIIFVAQLSVGFIRSWLMLHINARVNIALISDFLIKLMKLPLHFFDTKNTGDIMQRIGDHARIKSFLFTNSIGTIFSIISFFVFAGILGYYNAVILLIFLVGNTFYVAWVLFFMKYRRELDYKRFAQSAKEQSSMIQLIQGMQEIKLNNCEKQKRWDWENIQVKLFKISIKGLSLGQIQQSGSVFFSQTTNIILSFMAAKEVVEGDMTLGMMMSLTYIMGQVSAPISSFISFAQAYQDAKISLERLNEIHDMEDEEVNISSKACKYSGKKDITISKVSFSYSGSNREYVLNNIELVIPAKKITAIVGTSGSGKTTLMKLLMGFYSPQIGCIKVGDVTLDTMNPYFWRSKTGAVMQDGFIFSDTIANNIAVNSEVIDEERLLHAMEIANIKDYVMSLPLGYNTSIGMEGNGISQGQRQRILIARAVYKDPDFIFLDEATNALDANNENIIMKRLNEFYKGKTVVIIAHRLSTVRNADNIVVIDNGEIKECGEHDELIKKRGLYYYLVKNQLELGA